MCSGKKSCFDGSVLFQPLIQYKYSTTPKLEPTMATPSSARPTVIQGKKINRFDFPLQHWYSRTLKMSSESLIKVCTKCVHKRRGWMLQAPGAKSQQWCVSTRRHMNAAGAGYQIYANEWSAKVSAWLTATTTCTRPTVAEIPPFWFLSLLHVYYIIKKNAKIKMYLC